VSNAAAVFSTFLALAFGGMAVAFPPYETYNAILFKRELAKGKRPTHFRLNILFYDFGVMNNGQFFYYWQFFLRRFIFALMLNAWPQSRYLTLCLSTAMHIAAMLYVTYTKPFSTRTRNFSCIFTELGCVALHATLFAFLVDDSSLNQDYFISYARVFALVLLVIVSVNAILFAFELYTPLKKLAVILNIVKEEAYDEDANRMIEQFSESGDDDSLTEKNVTIGSKEMLEYGADYNDDRFELFDPDGDIKKEEQKAKRPRSPPKNQAPLISNFGSKVKLKDIPESMMDDNNEMGETMAGETLMRDNTHNQMSSMLTAKRPVGVQQLDMERIESSNTPMVPGGLGTATPNREESKFTTEARAPQPVSQKLYDDEDNSEKSGESPKEGKLMTPSIGEKDGFNAGQFEKALKDAKDTKDYNNLNYDN